jgi:hypothetical protein
MVVGSKQAGPIIRWRSATLLGALLVGVSGCGLGDLGVGPPAAPASQSRLDQPNVTPLASPIAGSYPEIWILSTNGINVHPTPDVQSPPTLVAAQGGEFDVLAIKQVAGQRWLNVQGHTLKDLTGWVLDDPTLVAHTEMDLHIDNANAYSVLTPAGWTSTSLNPSTDQLDGLSSGHAQQMIVQSAPNKTGLQTVPTKPGADQQDIGGIEVYGKTTFLSVYKLDGGGFELTVIVPWSDQRSYLFLFREPSATSPDTAAFESLLNTVIIFA